MNLKKSYTSRTVVWVIVIILIIIGIYVFQHPKQPAYVEVPSKEVTTSTVPISITTKEIKEDNFTGKVAVVSGTSTLALAAQTYIDHTVDDFRKQANTDVPAMKKEFGAGSPPASYEIDIDATDVKGPKTDSIVLDTYVFTGGAHGSSLYKVLTASLSDGTMLALSDVIKSDQQAAFTDFVKKQLKAWQPEGSTAPVVFAEDVDALKFGSFTNWSLDDKNLIIYFDQYEIGPGVLGEVAFPLSINAIQNFLNPGFN